MDQVVFWKAVIMGVVEGVTEFIPVSSTGHLILVQNWLGFEGRKENAFLVFIQLGAILAILWLYRSMLMETLLRVRSDPKARRFFLNLIVGTIPAAVIGLATEDWIESHLFKPVPVALALLLGGIAILWIERRYRPAHEDGDTRDISIRTALGVGTIQVLAILFPGVSRSGATIMGGLVLGLSRRTATEFSFFLAIPALLGASIVKMLGVREAITSADLPLFSVGFLVAFISALVVVKAFVGFVSHRSFTPFAWYRIAAGIALLVFFGSRSSF